MECLSHCGVHQPASVEGLPVIPVIHHRWRGQLYHMARGFQNQDRSQFTNKFVEHWDCPVVTSILGPEESTQWPPFLACLEALPIPEDRVRPPSHPLQARAWAR